MKITALLRKLTAIPGVSGREAVVSQPLLELLKEYCPDALKKSSGTGQHHWNIWKTGIRKAARFIRRSL